MQYIHTYIHINTNTYCTYILPHVHTCILKDHTDVIHTYIHTFLTSIHVYIGTYVHTYIHTYIYLYTKEYYFCFQDRSSTYTHSIRYPEFQTQPARPNRIYFNRSTIHRVRFPFNTYIHTYIHTCMHAYIYIYSYLHTYIHTLYIYS